MLSTGKAGISVPACGALWYSLRMQRARLTFYGVRGSMAAAGRATAGFGGNTTCIELCGFGERIICEAGTGIRELGNALMRGSRGARVDAAILISHLHWDHYIGLPFFKPLYERGNRFLLCGPGGRGKGFARLLGAAISPPYFPIRLRDAAARKRFKTLDGKPFSIGAVRVTPFPLHHPGGGFGWRFDLPDGRGVAIVSDNEPKDAAQERRTVQWLNGLDLLIHDAQYTPARYRQRRGWGHSPDSYPLELARQAGIPSVILTHFDPDDDDAVLRRRETQVRQALRGNGRAVRCRFAREGMTLLI